VNSHNQPRSRDSPPKIAAVANYVLATPLDGTGNSYQFPTMSIDLDLEHEYADRAYFLLTSLVTPRPIAFVTTLSPDGKINAAPFSFFNLMGGDPPILAFAPADRDDGTPKDTAINVRATHEFVVNLVDETIAEAMN